ncbi:MAG: hypothetical protein NVS9B15_07140 [Acidobacteriaceae bacterium]
MRKLVVTILLCSLSLLAQNREKRLILKNGDYQPADQWQVKGDRVHYHSTERNDWEDIPNSLIDWSATNKYNSAPSTSVADRSEAMKQADAEYAAALKEDKAAHPEVAADVRLPDDGGIWMLDTYQDKPQLAELVQSDGKLNKQTGKNMLRAVINPIPTGSRMSIELPGRHARVEAHVPNPPIFISSDDAVSDSGPPPLPPNQRWKIVRASLTKDGRVVSNLKINLLGKATESPDIIPAQIDPVNSQWIKVTPAQPLAAGQYALVEMLGPKEINMNVWDFGVNPSGPANPATRNDKKIDPLDNGYSKPVSADDEEQPAKKPKKDKKK